MCSVTSVHLHFMQDDGLVQISLCKILCWGQVSKCHVKSHKQWEWWSNLNDLNHFTNYCIWLYYLIIPLYRIFPVEAWTTYFSLCVCADSILWNCILDLLCYWCPQVLWICVTWVTNMACFLFSDQMRVIIFFSL